MRGITQSHYKYTEATLVLVIPLSLRDCRKNTCSSLTVFFLIVDSLIVSSLSFLATKHKTRQDKEELMKKNTQAEEYKFLEWIRFENIPHDDDD